MHSRSEQTFFFDLLCDDPCFQSIGLHELARSNLKKRLQRGRKYSYLVEIFGMAVLHAAPVVCVTRVDTVKLEDLRAMFSQSLNSVRVKRITVSLIGLLGPEYVIYQTYFWFPVTDKDGIIVHNDRACF
jgi:hypothetical protein